MYFHFMQGNFTLVNCAKYVCIAKEYVCMCVCVRYCEKTVSYRVTTFHMKILRHLNVYAWNLDLRIFK